MFPNTQRTDDNRRENLIKALALVEKLDKQLVYSAQDNFKMVKIENEILMNLEYDIRQPIKEMLRELDY